MLIDFQNKEQEQLFNLANEVMKQAEQEEDFVGMLICSATLDKINSDFLAEDKREYPETIPVDYSKESDKFLRSIKIPPSSRLPKFGNEYGEKKNGKMVIVDR